MLPDRVSNPGCLTYESGTLPLALRGPAVKENFNSCARFSSNLLLIESGLAAFPVCSDF